MVLLARNNYLYLVVFFSTENFVRHLAWLFGLAILMVRVYDGYSVYNFRQAIAHFVFAAWRSNSFWSGKCHRIRVGRVDERTETLRGQQDNSKTVRDRPCVSTQLTEPLSGLSNGLFADPKIPLTPKPKGVETPPLKFNPTSWRSAKMSIEHIWEHSGLLWSDAITNQSYRFRQSPEICDRRSSKCAVVERPDHHCGGGDLV